MAHFFWANVVLWTATAAFGYGATTLGDGRPDIRADAEQGGVPVRVDEMRLQPIEPAWAQQIVARPLFEPSRRPVAIADEADATDTAPDRTSAFRLIGVGGFSERLIAVVDTGDAQPTRLSRGDTLHGWEVAVVAHNAVTLQKDGESRVLDLVTEDAPVVARSSNRGAVRPSQSPGLFNLLADQSADYDE